MFKRKINIFRFIIIFSLYLLPGLLIPADKAFYNDLTKPLLTPDSTLYPIGFYIMIVLLAFFFTGLIHQHGYTDKTKYSYLLIFLNYVFLFTFKPLFFGNLDLYLGFASLLFAFSCTLILFIETFLYNKKLSYYLLPVLIWLFYLTYLTLQFYLLN